MKRKVLVQRFLCVFMLLVCMFLCHRAKTKVTAVSSFGNATMSNDTFEDFANIFYGDYFHA